MKVFRKEAAAVSPFRRRGRLRPGIMPLPLSRAGWLACVRFSRVFLLVLHVCFSGANSSSSERWPPRCNPNKHTTAVRCLKTTQ